MSDDLDFIVIDDIPEYVFCIPDDEELENVIPVKGEDGSFKYEKAAELPDTGEDGVLYLVPKLHETQTASGNPISINVTEGAGKLSDLKLDGNATQTTYSGDNLLPFTNQDYTLSGVRVYVQDGELYLNGTATANVSSNASYWKTSFAFTLPAGTYTFGASEYTFVQGEQFFMHKADQTDLGYIKNATAKTVTFTLEEETSVYLGIFWANGNVFNNKKISITLNSGSTAQPYERYVGGIPAPNPSYPQSISVVTGENVVKVVGKNLLNLNDTFERVYPPTLTYTQESNSVEITANTTTGAQYARYIVEVPDASQNYYLSCKAKKIVKGTDGTPRISVQAYGSNDNADWTNLSTTGMVITDPTEGVEYNLGRTLSGYKYYRIGFYNNLGTTVMLGEKTAYYDIQIELGATATPYQAFTAQDYAISLTGKNLFNKATSTAGYRIDSNGDPYANAAYFISDYIAVQPSTTYAYSRGAAGSGLSTIAYYKSDKTFISRTMPTIGSSDTSGTVTTPNDAYYARFCDLNEVLNSAQLELGSTATDYAAYSSIELAKIETYQDRIYKSDSKWYVEKQVGKVIFNGSEVWTAGTGGTLRLFYGSQYSDVLSSDQRQGFLSNNFHFIASGNETGAGFIYQQRFYFYYGDMSTDADAFKTWLSTHPTTVYYALATPTTTQITDTNLINQLEAAGNATLANGTNVISNTATGDNLAGDLELSYYEYDPTNRYNKWLWLDDDAAYEQM